MRVGRRALQRQRIRGFRREPVGQCAQIRERGLCERDLDRLLAQHALVREPHAVGGEHAGERVDEHGLHAELVGHQACMLAARAAEALQREARRVVPLLHRDLLDRIGHVGDGDAEEALGDVARMSRVSPVACAIAPAISVNFARTISASSGWSASGPKIGGKCAGWILPRQTLASVTVSGPPLR